MPFWRQHGFVDQEAAGIYTTAGAVLCCGGPQGHLHPGVTSEWTLFDSGCFRGGPGSLNKSKAVTAGEPSRTGFSPLALLIPGQIILLGGPVHDRVPSRTLASTPYMPVAPLPPVMAISASRCVSCPLEGKLTPAENHRPSGGLHTFLSIPAATAPKHPGGLWCRRQRRQGVGWDSDHTTTHLQRLAKSAHFLHLHAEPRAALWTTLWAAEGSNCHTRQSEWSSLLGFRRYERWAFPVSCDNSRVR